MRCRLSCNGELSIEATRHPLRMSHHADQQIVEVVRHATRQHAQALHALGLLRASLDLAPFALALALVFDVVQGDDPFLELPRPSPCTGAARMKHARGRLWAALGDASLGLERAPALDAHLPFRNEARAIDFVDGPKPTEFARLVLAGR